MWKYDDPGLKMSHEGAVPRTTVCHVLSYDKKTKKRTKRKQTQRRIYLTFAFSERHVTVKR